MSGGWAISLYREGTPALNGQMSLKNIIFPQLRWRAGKNPEKGIRLSVMKGLVKIDLRNIRQFVCL